MIIKNNTDLLIFLQKNTAKMYNYSSYFFNGYVTQRLECMATNYEVGGSNPSLPIFLFFIFYLIQFLLKKEKKFNWKEN